MKAFGRLYQRLDSTTSINLKVEALVQYFEETPPLIRPGGHLLPREKVFLRFLKQWILQLRASPACRMTCG